MSFSTQKRKHVVAENKLTKETTCCVCDFLVDSNTSGKKKWSNFVVEREHLFLRNMYWAGELTVIKIDTIEKYAETFEMHLNLFLIVEGALEDEIKC